MLPPAHRLRLSRDFTAVTRARARAGSATMVAYARRSAPRSLSIAGPDSVASPPAAPRPSAPPSPPTRFGFVVSRAVGASVTRHRVARRLRHLAAARLSTLPVALDIVVRATPAAATATYDTLGSDLARVTESAAARALRHGPARA